MSSRKNIFITGAASGIGRETALYFARQGWFVGIVDVNRMGLLSLQQEIGEGNCCVGLMDVTNVQDVKEAVSAFTSKTGGKMDVLFNNAGIVRMGPNEEITLRTNTGLSTSISKEYSTAFTPASHPSRTPPVRES